jgi:hypothetical protein
MDMKTNDELYDDLRKLAISLGYETNNEHKLDAMIARLEAMRNDRVQLMSMWVTMYFDHVIMHGDSAKVC